ncbi:MAG: sigma-70 family RNA polymerase sigma factor [Planctomycetaceae bacterium]|nr:sigma-70 family RNA polymerase sigma factor [Planctomycetaceae bacterium]
MTRVTSKPELFQSSTSRGAGAPAGNGNGHSNGNGNGHSAATAGGGNGQNSETARPDGAPPRSDTQTPDDPDDQTLVDRCRAGDDAAWAEVHARCQSQLIRQIRYTLGERARDQNLVDEIAARVWFGLVADDGYLLERFEPGKGSGLSKYIAAIARFEVLRHQRGEFRRRQREQETQFARRAVHDDRHFAEMTIDVQEFLPTLTPREKEFFYRVLLGNDGEQMEISAANAWQLRHRIRRKLLEFLDLD